MLPDHEERLVCPVFRITTASGKTVTGLVQGSGGVIGSVDVLDDQETVDRYALERMRRYIRMAELGHELGIYEPEPGHVKVYTDVRKHAFEANPPWEAVPLKGARVEITHERPSLLAPEQGNLFS